MEIFQKTMDFFQKNSHVFRISWEIIEGTREKNKKEEGIYTKESTAEQIHDKNKKDSTAETKQIHGKNRNKSTVKTKRNPRQKQKGIHGKNKKESTQNRKERRAIRA